MEPCRPSPPPRISSTIIVSKSVGHSSGQSQWATAEMACATPSRILLLASSSPVKKKQINGPVHIRSSLTKKKGGRTSGQEVADGGLGGRRRFGRPELVLVLPPVVVDVLFQ